MNNNCYACQMKSKIMQNDEMPGGMTALPESPVVTMAYVPFQLDNNTYKALEGFPRGTIFPCLDKPFKGGCIK